MMFYVIGIDKASISRGPTLVISPAIVDQNMKVQVQGKLFEHNQQDIQKLKRVDDDGLPAPRVSSTTLPRSFIAFFCKAANSHESRSTTSSCHGAKTNLNSVDSKNRADIRNA